MNKVKWIFFDIGSTLVDESAVYEDRISEITCSNNIKVTSKNISPKAKKYGIIEPTNKVGDLDAVESICRR